MHFKLRFHGSDHVGYWLDQRLKKTHIHLILSQQTDPSGVSSLSLSLALSEVWTDTRSVCLWQAPAISLPPAAWGLSWSRRGARKIT